MIIFDVGANNGSFSIPYTNNVENKIYAFEPTPHLLETYLYKVNKPNYIVIPKAISVKNETVKFHIAGQSDWGCSSIHKFSDDLEKNWPGRTDFKVTQTIDVECITMKDFIEQNNIEKIDIFHCDTQGNDFNVLLSFGDHIKKIVKGEVEAFEKNPLYKDINNSVSNIVDFLTRRNFKITNIASNDQFRNEVNIYFENLNI